MKYILDTAAFIADGFNIENALTIVEIKQELKHILTKARFDIAVESGRLKLAEPSQRSIDYITRLRIQEADKLSNIDIKLLALAYEKKAILITDDYLMQNICKKLSIKFTGVKQKTIKRYIKYKNRCKNCGRQIEDICEVCGLNHKFS
jgi:UPF0271 protein